METRRNTLSRSERLHSLKAIACLFEEGKRGYAGPYRFVYRVGELQDGTLPGQSDESVSVLFTVPKKLHKRANKRNLLRRRTKEAYRLLKHPLLEKAGNRGKIVHIALIYNTKEIADYRTAEHAVRKIVNLVGKIKLA